MAVIWFVSLGTINDMVKNKIRKSLLERGLTLSSQSRDYLNADVHKNIIEINGQTYRGIIDVTKLTAGQYIDIKTFCKNSDLIFENLANIMAVIYIEEGAEYEGTKHANRARIFQEKLNCRLYHQLKQNTGP